MIIRRLNNWLGNKMEDFIYWVGRGFKKDVPTIGPGELDGIGGRLTSYADRTPELTHIPPGEATISFHIDPKGKPFQDLFELYQNFVHQQSQAQQFTDKIKHDHRLPPLEDADMWKELGADYIGLKLQPSGNYKITMVNFKDRSLWSEGKVVDV